MSHRTYTVIHPESLREVKTVSVYAYREALQALEEAKAGMEQLNRMLEKCERSAGVSYNTTPIMGHTMGEIEATIRAMKDTLESTDNT